ncbi:MAG: HD-GYP domain-containing protein [Clostridia bacterium]|nr:HD-GYP domain-containing protein [Clostridia bacterium]
MKTALPRKSIPALPEKLHQRTYSADEVRGKISRFGHLLSRVTTVTRALLLFGLIFQLLMLLLITVSPDRFPFLWDYITENAFFRFLQKVAISTMSREQQLIIGETVIILSHIVLLIFVQGLHRLTSTLASSGHPFDVKAARAIRHRAFLILFLSFYNFPMAVLLFLFTLLFTYIMEYGAYIQQQADETNRIQEEVIVNFAEISENKSGQTGQHIRRVSEYTKVIAEEMGLSPQEIEDLRLAATMHDIGKLLVPTEILEKPGKLTDEEYRIIQQHTTWGGQLLENVEGREMHLSRAIALEHHERYDGRGYPARKKGGEISLPGRIVAVADVYDALTSRRSYKDSWPEENAFREILNGRGTQFDPQVVDAFQKAHDRILEVRETFRDD